MLFSSYDFIFVFLPLILLIAYIIKKYNFLPGFLLYILIASSLIFYGWSDYNLIFIILFSIVANSIFSFVTYKTQSKLIFYISILFNLALLGYFKYTNFFIQNINQILSTDIHFMNIALPLGISFFTFQQIAYQVDIYKGITKPATFPEYALFITFFAQLIAGPIVHYKHFVPQIKNIAVHSHSLAPGITLFVLGLSKKVLLADKLAPLVNYYYTGIGQSNFAAGIIDTWMAVLAYSFQLYFDFSGYADMALGIGLCFCLILPINFFSPYKAVSLTDFWRRWHITLSDFLKEYVYIPLGGNKVKSMQLLVNILIVMTIGGIWHGAGWTFVLWGFVSGLIMGIEKKIPMPKMLTSKMTILRIIKTYLIITLLWVLFRADNIGDSLVIYKTLAGQTYFWIGPALYEPTLYGTLEKQFISITSFLVPSLELRCLMVWMSLLGLCATIAFFLPNTGQIFSRQLNISAHNTLIFNQSGFPKKLIWAPNLYWLIATILLFLLDTAFIKRQVEFLYFQF